MEMTLHKNYSPKLARGARGGRLAGVRVECPLGGCPELSNPLVSILPSKKGQESIYPYKKGLFALIRQAEKETAAYLEKQGN